VLRAIKKIGKTIKADKKKISKSKKSGNKKAAKKLSVDLKSLSRIAKKGKKAVIKIIKAQRCKGKKK